MSDKVAVTYQGPKDRSESSDYYQVEGTDGTVYLLYRDASTAIPSEVAQELESADFHKHHNFEIGPGQESTVPELKAELDELGVEYPSDAKKAELQDLLTNAKAEQEGAS